MAAIDDLISQIEDPALRARLREEVVRLTKEKKFGLVFEEHLPELTPISNAKIRVGSLVARRDGLLTDTWRVLHISADRAICYDPLRDKQADIALNDLVVVRRFGEPIFPTLTPIDHAQNGPADAPWHTLIEADNYHALQLLEYLYTGKIDCIYIDPPYNTGARDWKYNNDYVDKNDRWRHSKWLAMMKRRLVIAKRLLKPDTGVLIVTIDEHEVHHLRCLLQNVLPNSYIQMITTVINPKGVTQGRFSRVEEYIIYCFMDQAFVSTSDDDLLNPPKTSNKPRWKGLLRSGTNARRVDRKNMFYPVLIDKNSLAAVGVKEALPIEQEPDLDADIDGHFAAWPIRTDGSYGNWGVGFETLSELIEKGYVSVGKFDPSRKTYGISYISKPNQELIDKGKIIIVGRDEETNVVQIEYVDTKNSSIKTIWHRTRHDAGAYGSDILKTILGKTGLFDFPKSIYSVRDAIAPILYSRPRALVLDFFAGSGTTLNALNLINLSDDGQRRCILVTNNEVSDEEATQLNNDGYRPGVRTWEQFGICQSVTWPRSKYTILGKRDDGTVLDGEYLTGKIISKEKPRTFKHLGFIDPQTITTAARKKEIAALIEGVPMSHIKTDTAFFVSEDERHSAAVLFDDTQAEAFLEALEEMEHITHFYIITQSNALFHSLKTQINELLGPYEVQEEEKRPMSAGFPANLEYFKLDFLEKDRVALGRQFRAILPILWMRAGAIGPRPEIPAGEPLPAYLIPSQTPFAVLLDETRFAAFKTALSGREGLTHLFLVTDSAEAYQEMASQLNAPHVIQLYRDYLENFAINQGESA